jgi:hypothetical protein
MRGGPDHLADFGAGKADAEDRCNRERDANQQ